MRPVFCNTLFKLLYCKECNFLQINSMYVHNALMQAKSLFQVLHSKIAVVTEISIYLYRLLIKDPRAGVNPAADLPTKEYGVDE